MRRGDALLDMPLLLRAAADRIDWTRVLGWLDDRRIAAHLQLMLSYLETRELLVVPPVLRTQCERVAVLPPVILRILSGMVDRYQVRGMMRAFPPPRPGEGSPPGRTPAGTLRSRLRTLRTAAASGRLRGLLQPLDVTAWEMLLREPASPWRPLVVPWCLLFPPGDPDRFVPGRRIAGASSRR